ncbi:MAG TPA: hypothetical protein VGI10_01275 [Polyangiaceae bacterium]|jgi:hypothetical protein
MARNPWESEADVFMPRRGGSRALRFVLGILVVGCATFVFGYYFPLLRAYQALSARYQQERTDAQAAAQSLSQAQASLKQEQAARSKLEAQQKDQDGSKKLDADKVATLRRALADKLDKAIKGGDAALLGGNAAGVAVAARALFVPKKHELSASGKALLCDIAKLGTGDPLRAKLVFDGANAATSAWSDQAEAASVVVQALQDKCGMPSARLTLAARTAPVAAPDAATGGPAGDRVEFELGRD